MSGLQKIEPPSKRRLPITFQLLTKLIDTIPFVLKTSQVALFQALFSVMYHGCLRAGEVVKSNTVKHVLRRKAIKFKTLDGKPIVVINFKSYKHSRGSRPRVRLHQAVNVNYCLVHLYAKLNQIKRAKIVYGFSHRNGSLVTRDKVEKVLLKCLTRLQI